jgi:hypothetical protein
VTFTAGQHRSSLVEARNESGHALARFGTARRGQASQCEARNMAKAGRCLSGRGLSRRCEARNLGAARLGLAGHGRSRLGTRRVLAGQDVVWPGSAWQGITGLGTRLGGARLGSAGLGLARLRKSRHGSARLGTWRGRAGQGLAWQGAAGPVGARRSKTGRGLVTHILRNRNQGRGKVSCFSLTD